MIECTVLLPVRNEEHTIIPCLNSILATTYPHEKLELIVIDGESTDDTNSQLAQYDWRDLAHQILGNPKKIVATALNLGLKKASGKYIVRMDAHTKYDPSYISQCVELLASGIAHNVGGPMRTVGTTDFQGAVVFATSHAYGIGNSSFHFESNEGFAQTVYLGAFKKEVFDSIGLFDEELVRNQDDEFNYRMILNGFKIYLTPRILSHYSPRNSLLKLFNQYFQYGYWKVRVIQKCGRLMSWRHLVPLIFVIGLSLPLCFAFAIPQLVRISLSMVILHFSIGALIAWTSNKELSKTSRILLPLVFLILHLAYGFGFLAGFFRYGLKFFKKQNIQQGLAL